MVGDEGSEYRLVLTEERDTRIQSAAYMSVTWGSDFKETLWRVTNRIAKIPCVMERAGFGGYLGKPSKIWRTGGGG